MRTKSWFRGRGSGLTRLPLAVFHKLLEVKSWPEAEWTEEKRRIKLSDSALVPVLRLSPPAYWDPKDQTLFTPTTSAGILFSFDDLTSEIAESLSHRGDG